MIYIIIIINKNIIVTNDCYIFIFFLIQITELIINIVLHTISIKIVSKCCSLCNNYKHCD